MQIQSYAFPFDPSGLAGTNKIVGERHTISPPNGTDYYIVIPDATPFFIESLKVVHHPSGRVLVEGVDYYCTHRFHEASLQCGKAIAGSITLLDRTLIGVLELEYQTLGGEWTLNSDAIAALLASELANPRITTWEMVVELPSRFPPIDHEWDIVDMTGATDVVTKLAEIEDAILASNTGTTDTHLQDKNNPHEVTKTQVGLGNVPNFPAATQQQAVDGVDNASLMTPLRTREAVQALANDLTSHAGQIDNPHDVTKAQVGLGNVDNYPTASVAEVLTGTETGKFVTPAGVKAAVDKEHADYVVPHINARNNPHQVSKAQVGLSNVDNFPTATHEQAVAGVDATAFMTPQRTREAIDAQFGDTVISHVNDKGNPHEVTKAQVGLDKVVNLPLATVAASQAGTDDSGYMTPRLVAAAIAALGSGGGGETGGSNPAYDAHLASMANPHGVTATQVNAYDKQEIDVLMVGKLGYDATATNSAKLEGLSAADVIARAKTRVDWAEVVPSAGLHEGVTWTMLAYHYPTEVVDNDNPLKDIVFYITGGDRRLSGTVPIYLVKLNLFPAPYLSVEQISGDSNDTQFGYVYNNGDQSVQLFSRNPTARNAMSALVLSDPGNAVRVWSDPVDYQPAGLIYAEEFHYNGAAANAEVPPGDLSFGINPHFESNYDFGAMVEFANVVTSVEEENQALVRVANMLDDFHDFIPCSSYADDQRVAVKADLIGWDVEPATKNVLYTAVGTSLQMLVSPHSYTDYQVEVELSSTSVEDMAMGVVAAYTRKNGKEYAIHVLRTPGGFQMTSSAGDEPGGTFGKLLTVGYNLLQDDAIDLGSTSTGLTWGDGVADADRAGTPYNDANGWNAAGVCRIRVTRNGNAMIIQTSQFGSTDVTTGPSVTIDFNSDPMLSVFKKPTQWGVAKYKQGQARFKLINHPDFFQPYVFYKQDTDGRDISTVNRFTGISWTTQPLKLTQSFVKPGRLVYSEYSLELYYARRDGALKPLPLEAYTNGTVTILTN